MKKLLFLSAVLAILLGSCSNDDIDVTTKGDLTFNVSTQSVYDEFGIADKFKQDLLTKGYSVGVYTYIYEKSGKLVASDSIYSESFQRVSLQFPQIETGDYDIISMEMVVDNDNHKSPNWIILGQEDISTIRIENIALMQTYWYAAVGVSNFSISVSHDSSNQYDVEPKGIGAIVNLECSNFGNSPFARAAFYTKDSPSARYLSSSYKGNDRYIYNKYTDKNTWIKRADIVGNPTIDGDYVTWAYILEESSVECCFGAALRGSNGEIESSFYSFPSNGFKYDFEDNHVYYAGFFFNRIDSDYIYCDYNICTSYEEWYNWNKKQYENLPTTPTTPVEKNPKPYLTFGETYNTVNSYMNSTTMTQATTGYGDDYFYAQYINQSKSVIYQYNFNTNKDNLNQTLIGYSTDSYNLTSAKEELEELIGVKGTYKSDLDGYFYSTSNYLGLLYEEEDLIMALFIPSTSNSAPSKSDIKQFKKKQIKHPALKSKKNNKMPNEHTWVF